MKMITLFLLLCSFSLYSQGMSHLKVQCAEKTYHVPRAFLEGLNLAQTKCIESGDGMIVLHSPAIARRQIEKIRVLSYRVSNNSPLLAWLVSGEVSNVTYPGIFTENCGEYLLGARIVGADFRNNLQLALFFETPKVVTIKFTQSGTLFKRGRLAYYGGNPDTMRFCEGYETSFRSPKDKIIDVTGSSYLYFLNHNLKLDRQEMSKIKY